MEGACGGVECQKEVVDKSAAEHGLELSRVEFCGLVGKDGGHCVVALVVAEVATEGAR